ncbi:MAG TPA: cohesin domain-containing protein [Vicinamibacterales bacterium]|nr:cohesin domain-containing protein [Vicinamibacterales bacterium]
MRRLRWGSLALAVVMATGCATSEAIKNAEKATQRGDHDAAVAYYRTALGREPERVELKIALERATRRAAAEHIHRARDLEAQDQLAGAVAEYRLAADLDVTNTLALGKAIELERRMRAAADAARPQPRIDQLRQQAQQQSAIPRLDPRVQVPQIRMPNVALRDILTAISRLTNINITYDQNLDQLLQRNQSLEIQGTSLEEALNQLMVANTLTYKVVSPTTIFVYQDNPTNRQKYEDQYTQTFYISHADPAELVQILNQLLAQTTSTRPIIFQNKTTNSIVVRATAPVMQVISDIIDSNDKAKPEVMVEAEILEVDRNFLRKLGLDLTNYAIGLTFSPELAPPNTSGGLPPASPPPFNANTVSRGVSSGDFYVQSPTAVIQLLESNTNTKTLAKSQLRGRDGTPMSLRLGDLVPIPQTVFSAAAAGGVANIPSTQVQYQPVGINLLFTPRVTQEDEIVLEALTLQKSGLGNNLNIGGQIFPTIVERTAVSAVRLRDGEANMLAGLLRDDDRKSMEGFPGINKIPIIRSLFGNSDTQVDQTDLVMIITPHIIRGHDLKPSDLRPRFIGTGQNIGGGAPSLLSLDALSGVPSGQGQSPTLTPTGGAQGQAPAAGAAGAPAAATPPAGGQTPPPAAQTPPPGTTGQPAQPPRAPAAVPIQAVPPGGAAAEPPPTAGRITVTVPTGPDGTVAAGSGPYTVPVQISGVSNVGTLSLSISYNPAVLRALGVNPGTFMTQGGVTATFVPSIDQTAGRIDIAISRPTGQTGASGTGLVASITFQAAAAGSATISVSGVASAPTGATVPLLFTPANVVVK